MNFRLLLSSPLTALRSGGRPPVPARPATARRPAIGATLVCNQFRMTVQAGLTRDLWRHLVANGWRELSDGRNRYRYRALPSNVISALFGAPADQWDSLLVIAFRRALQEDKAPLEAAA